MNWRWLQAFPKFALVAVLIVGSSVAFYIWRVTLPARRLMEALNRPGVPEDIGPKIAQVEAKFGRLVLVDGDLYDIDAGKAIFKSWLKDGMPSKLFWEPASKTFLAEYDRGYVRSSADGKEVARLIAPHPFIATAGNKVMLLCRDRDIWRAEVDWPSLKFINERKITSVAQFNDQNFAGNVVAGTDDILLIRLPTQLVRVVLADGSVKPFKIGLEYNSRRRSPDGKCFVGLENRRFFCYDLNSDETKNINIGSGVINGYQWLDNDRCAAIAGGKVVILYDRLKHALTELVALPAPCQTMGEPSPDGRYVFCVSRNSGILVDTEKKTATPVTGGAGVVWVSNDTFAFSREVVDSELRGTWMQTVGEGERRISPEPYLVGRKGPMMLGLKSAGAVVMATSHGIATMKADGTEFKEVVKLPRPPTVAVAIQEWSQ